MGIRAASLTAFLGLTAAGAAEAQAPLSAIDWLSDSVATQVDPLPSQPREEAVTRGVTSETITVTALDDLSFDSVGLIPAAVSGLPRDLWGITPSGELARLLALLKPGLLPAMQDLVTLLLLAELDPPVDSDPTDQLFLARVDVLLGLGAVDQAHALLERAGPETPETFRRWFDTSLLIGTEKIACDTLRAAPDLTPKLPARIFCLARGGDWNAAVLTLGTGRALGEVTPDEDDLLTRFLDIENFEDAAPLPVPNRPSPLTFRLYEAIGEALVTTTLPLAFAFADLDNNTGWKAQLEAAERLAKAGSFSENKLLGLYTERSPAASGGIWDRVTALQRFDAALETGNPPAIAATLPAAWFAMRQVKLQTVFASLYAEPLQKIALEGDIAALSFRIGLLSRDYESVAAKWTPRDAEDSFLVAVARGDLSGVTPYNAVAQAIADGFTAPSAPPELAALVRNQELGAAILRAILQSEHGTDGDLDKLVGALALLRSVGLEDVARRAALQVLIQGLSG